MLNIKVNYNGKTKELQTEHGSNLLNLLRSESIYIPAFCGGNGTCGKCLVHIEDGKIGGMGKGSEVLACQAVLDSDCKLTIKGSEKDFSIMSAFAGSSAAENVSDDLAIAVDIGTTTCVVCAFDLKSGGVIGVFAELNGQRKFGADVISRIDKCAENLNEMTAMIRGQILKGIESLISEHGINTGKIKKMAVVGNTAMMSIFMGVDCTSLGFKPFTVPQEVKSGGELKFNELFGSDVLGCDVSALPCISAYIGADALSSALFCGIRSMEGYNIVADVGTNGEILLSSPVESGKVGNLTCASTAAGPALEGGNISCGMGGASGAVCAVKFDNNSFVYKTIGNKPPIGICGSGAIDLIAELVGNEIIDDTGLLDDDYFDDGVKVCENVTFTQGDVRQIQLAKSALRSGVDCLIKNVGIKYSDINKLFLGGGFANNANVENMVKIGLFPKEISEKIVPSGNTALGGAVKWLMSEDARLEAADIAENAHELELGDNPYFSERFSENMFFE